MNKFGTNENVSEDFSQEKAVKLDNSAITSFSETVKSGVESTIERTDSKDSRFKKLCEYLEEDSQISESVKNMIEKLDGMSQYSIATYMISNEKYETLAKNIRLFKNIKNADSDYKNNYYINNFVVLNLIKGGFSTEAAESLDIFSQLSSKVANTLIYLGHIEKVAENPKSLNSIDLSLVVNLIKSGHISVVLNNTELLTDLNGTIGILIEFGVVKSILTIKNIDKAIIDEIHTSLIFSGYGKLLLDNIDEILPNKISNNNVKNLLLHGHVEHVAKILHKLQNLDGECARIIINKGFPKYVAKNIASFDKLDSEEISFLVSMGFMDNAIAYKALNLEHVRSVIKDILM